MSKVGVAVPETPRVPENGYDAFRQINLATRVTLGKQIECSLSPEDISKNLKNTLFYQLKSRESEADTSNGQTPMQRVLGEGGAALHSDLNSASFAPVRRVALMTMLTWLPVYAPALRKSEFENYKAQKTKFSDLKSSLSPINLADFNVADTTFDFLKSQFDSFKESGGGGVSNLRILQMRKPISNSIRDVKNLLAPQCRSTEFLQGSFDCASENEGLEKERETHIGAQTYGRRFKQFIDRKDITIGGGKVSQYSLSASWAKHSAGYETLQFFEEAEALQGLPANSGLKTLTTLPKLTSDSQFRPTAIDRLNYLDWGKWIGRFVQGANYLVLPVEAFLDYNSDDLSQSNFVDFSNERAFREPKISLQGGAAWELEAIVNLEALASLDPRDRVLFELAHRAAQKSITVNRALIAIGFKATLFTEELSQRDVSNLQFDGINRLATLRALCREASVLPEIASLVDAFVLRLIRNALHTTFRLNHVLDPDLELIGTSLRKREAYFFSDMRAGNIEKDGNGKEEWQKVDILTTSLLIDISLNDYVRGRVLANIAAFSAERIVPLVVAPMMKFMHFAMSTVEQSLSIDLADWSTRLEHEANGHKSHDASEAQHEFLSRLRQRTAELEAIGSFVPKGLDYWVRYNVSASNRLQERLRVMAEEPIEGFLCIREFLSQRMTRASASILAAGERYHLIKSRIEEYQAKVDAEAEVDLGEEQKLVLEKLDRLTNFGITYYLGSTITAIVMAFLLIGWPYSFESQIKDQSALVLQHGAVGASPASAATQGAQKIDRKESIKKQEKAFYAASFFIAAVMAFLIIPLWVKLSRGIDKVNTNTLSSLIKRYNPKNLLGFVKRRGLQLVGKGLLASMIVALISFFAFNLPLYFIKGSTWQPYSEQKPTSSSGDSKK
jgi:hypothetical protein